MSTSVPTQDVRIAAPPPPFSEGELRRRRQALGNAAAGQGAAVVLAYGANRHGSAIPWLTTWPVTREAVLVLPSDRPAHLLVGFENHVPNAEDTLRRAGLGDRAGPLGDDPAGALLDTLAGTPGAQRCLALVGAFPASLRNALASWADRLVELDTLYTRLRMVKSEEELRWLSHAAALTDRAASALVEAATDGASEQEMVAAAEHAYRADGGSHHICYVSTTSMDAPDRCVPAQWPTERRTTPGSAVVFELSAGWGPDYPAQLLRTVSVGAPPAPLYARLHEVAESVRDELIARIRPGRAPQDLRDLLDRVSAEGFTTVDHLVHGLGGGYLPPVVGERSALRGLHAEPLRAGMTLVVQPNVCTPDRRAGVQTGEMVVVTDTGCRSLHRFPPGLIRVPFRGSG